MGFDQSDSGVGKRVIDLRGMGSVISRLVARSTLPSYNSQTFLAETTSYLEQVKLPTQQHTFLLTDTSKTTTSR